MPDIRLHSVHKRYGSRSASVVSGLSLAIEDGSFTCILGPSGCGKSTLLRLIAGLEHLSSGQIQIGEVAADSPEDGVFVPPERRGVGLVFQSYALWPHMTVAENVAFGLQARSVSRQQQRERVAEILTTLRIRHLDDRYPGQLSGGEQQRVALARTLVLNPRVLLLDEPLSSLDASLRLQMRSELARLHRELQTTIVFVTHDQWEAMTLATQIALMDGGALQQVGSPGEIYRAPKNRFVAEFIGTPPINLFEIGTPMSERLLALMGQKQKCFGGRYTLGLRPESMELIEKPDQTTFAAEIQSVLPTGGGWIVEMLVDGQIVNSVLHRAMYDVPAWQSGDTVNVRPLSDGFHLFDADGVCVDLSERNVAAIQSDTAIRSLNTKYPLLKGSQE